MTPADRAALDAAHRHALAFRESLAERPVGPTATLADLRAALGGALPEDGSPADRVVDELARSSTPGLVANAGPRFFGFVIGGSGMASVGADWLTAAWDQNTGLYATSPANAVCEEVAAGWLKELLGLPASASTGFVTGCQMAHATALAAARHHVLRRAGWDAEQDGLWGAPRVRVVAGDELHVTLTRALRFLGMGERNVVRVPSDANGAMRPDELARALAAGSGPTIVCAQSGNVNTGACDDLAAIAALARQHGAWMHVDGAFGLWAAASARRRHLVRGVELADSWATDAHKWLNVPYDSGLAFCAHPDAHRTAMTARAPYLVQADASNANAPRDPVDWVPEFSRRARGFTVYAALRELGRRGVEALVDRCCDHASRFADLLRAGGAEILNDVLLNQVLVRFGDDAGTQRAIARAQADGTLWLGGTVWRGRPAARISVSGEATTAADIDRSAAALLRAAGP